MTTKADSSILARQEIEARLDAFYAAWEVRDGAGMRALFGGGDRLLVWGTTREERIEGRAEAAREFDGWVDACPPWTSFEVTHREVGVRDGLAWAAEEVTGAWSHEARRKSGAEHFRITTVWEEEGGWKLVHVHMDLLRD
jgi:ketosteroid isomerase-like protein